MFFFKNNDDKDKSKQSEFDKVSSERDDIKKELFSIYIDLGFSEDNIKQLFKIIDNAQDQIENLKKQLIGSNINQDPKDVQKRITDEINQISFQMNIDLKAKTDEIMEKINR